jgi:hypothetical protein
MAVPLAVLCGPFHFAVSVLNAFERHLIAYHIYHPKSSPFISDKVQSGQPHPFLFRQQSMPLPQFFF